MHNALNKQDKPEKAKPDLTEPYCEVYSKATKKAASVAAPACGSRHTELDTELLTKKELAKRLKVCQRTIEVLCNDSKIPRIVFGRNVRYKWRDVLSALDNSEAEAGCLVSTRGGLL